MHNAPYTHRQRKALEQECLSKAEKEKIAKMIAVYREITAQQSYKKFSGATATEVTKDEDCQLLTELVVRNHVLISATAP